MRKYFAAMDMIVECNYIVHGFGAIEPGKKSKIFYHLKKVGWIFRTASPTTPVFMPFSLWHRIYRMQFPPIYVKYSYESNFLDHREVGFFLIYSNFFLCTDLRRMRKSEPRFNICTSPNLFFALLHSMKCSRPRFSSFSSEMHAINKNKKRRYFVDYIIQNENNKLKTENYLYSSIFLSFFFFFGFNLRQIEIRLKRFTATKRRTHFQPHTQYATTEQKSKRHTENEKKKKQKKNRMVGREKVYVCKWGKICCCYCCCLVLCLATRVYILQFSPYTRNITIAFRF